MKALAITIGLVRGSDLFQDLWQFVGLTSEFGASSSVLRRWSAIYDLLIVKDEGSYRAFWNVCPHRNHPIAEGDSTHVDLTCPYHGWCFRSDGSLRAIPFHDECYQFSERERSTIGLRPVALERMGDFLFVNLSPRPFPIGQQFSEKLQKDLVSISSAVRHVRIVKQVREFNWKLICENLRDGLHPVFLHQNTLMKAIEFSAPAIPKDVPIQLLRLRDGSYGGPDVALTNDFPFKSRFSNPWPAQGRYHNFHLYPNVHIAIADGGYSFVVELFQAISETQTEVSIYYCLTENDLSETERDAFFHKLQEESFDVYEEDFSALEKIQKVYSAGAVRSYKMGVYERMISRFEKINLKRGGFSLAWAHTFFMDLPKVPSFLLRYVWGRLR